MDENRKIRRLSHEAFRLYWTAVPYARRHGTSGRLHMDDVRDLCARHRIKNVKAAVAELLHVPREYGFDAGCWEEVEPGVYQVHDHEEYNPPTSKERMRRKRERDRTSPVEWSDEDVTSPPVTGDVEGDGSVTRSDTPRAEPRAGYPNPVPEPVTTGLRPSVPDPNPVPTAAPPLPPTPGAVAPLPLPPEVQKRVEELQDGCCEILARGQLKPRERDLVLAWASTLRRSGELVPVVEILAVVRHEMLRPTPDGNLPATLSWCADAVATLARAPAASSFAGDWRRDQEAAEAAGFSSVTEWRHAQLRGVSRGQR